MPNCLSDPVFTKVKDGGKFSTHLSLRKLFFIIILSIQTLKFIYFFKEILFQVQKQSNFLRKKQNCSLNVPVDQILSKESTLQVNTG